MVVDSADGRLHVVEGCCGPAQSCLRNSVRQNGLRLQNTQAQAGGLAERVFAAGKSAGRIERICHGLVGLKGQIMGNGFVRACLSLLALLATQSSAFQLSSLSPQGEVARIRQVVVKFDQAAVRLGDVQSPAPVAITCNDQSAAQGSGRWTTERSWTFNFAQDLPPGVHCEVQASSELRSVSGATLTGNTRFRFSSGGPFVQNIVPYAGSRIDEDQHFILRLNGPATPGSIQAHVWCAMRGIGERIAVRLVEGEDRLAMLRARRMEREAQAAPLKTVTLACNRRLTPSADVQLVLGKGVRTPGMAGSPGVASSQEQRFDFKVREPFAAEFQCERENAQSACLPIRPLSLHFNAPVARTLAEGVRLTAGGQRLAPVFDRDAGAAVNGVVDSVRFQTVLPENTAFLLELPAGFKDDAGRTLRNGASFPLKVATGPMPPLAKFAAAPFGIVERLAEPGGVALLPVTLRNVEAALPTRDLQVSQSNGTYGSKVSDLQPDTDAQIIAWFRKLQRYNDYRVPRDQAARDVRGPLPMPLDEPDRDGVQTRLVSLLQGQPGVQTLDLPRPVRNDPRPFEVVGIPLTPGFHVVEIASPMLGASLLDPRHGSDRTMFVRTSVLVTNLGVHFKLGRENALAWVTALDSGRPVPQARVQVSDCKGRKVASGVTDAMGIARFAGIAAQAPVCDEDGAYVQAYFVSARAANGLPGRKGLAEDLAFTWSDWHKGIEPWRFNLPTSQQHAPDTRSHTIFDRTLLRAGETVSMKHILRSETLQGMELPANRPDKLVITHVGSGQQYPQPLALRRTATGGLSAESVFAIPSAAKLGVYEVSLAGGGEGAAWPSGQFRVEAFRLPVLKGSVLPTNRDALIRPQKLPVDVQIQYVSGGGASGLPVQISALTRNKALRFDGFDDFSFTPPRSRNQAAPGTEEDEEQNAGADTRVVADKLPLTLDRSGTGRVLVEGLPAFERPQELLLEATYADPGGEVQTLRSSHNVWPAAVVAGIKATDWVSVGQNLQFQALALDLAGKPLADVPLQVFAIARIVTTSRKRIVGGFYAYDNRTEIKELGQVCSGRSDARGMLACKATLAEPGEVELVVTATDRQGQKAQAASSVYVTRHGEVWFGGENHDRMDVLPEKKSYEPGETAKLQVRMPFRFATALVAVEREGVIETQVLQLRGEDPTIALKIKPQWAPNVYVSVLSVRGRLREVPWYSFFTWGYKAPREWWTSFWYGGREYVAPTAMVDLSKPAFRLGVAEIQVGSRAHKLDVSVKADQAAYPVRGKAQIAIQVKLPDGRPAASAEVAIAAVDEALLELMPNTSWDLLGAMLQRRVWGVETATAQMEIIGRRHYGRKAVAPGGGGGHSATRELLDTLLLWNPRMQLDADGRANVTVPLNDALTRFRIVAVADAATGLFGTGSTQVRVTQDLQIISGLPPLVRDGDRFQARFTLRNTTAKTMRVTLTPRVPLLELAAQSLDIPAGEARELAWMVTAPVQSGATRLDTLQWDIQALDALSGARDGLKIQQRLDPLVPLAVQQATLVQIDRNYALPVQSPASAMPGRGGLKLTLQPRLAEGLQGVRDWFARYPFSCLEQQASKAIGLRDAAAWQLLRAQLPAYLDADGLASYFPPRVGDGARGSDTLTAYLLATSHEAAALNPAFALDDAVRTAMERGLIGFVEGRIQRDFWSPRPDLDIRKLAALEALSRYGKASARLLDSITIAPNQWPTHAVIDWLMLLQRVQDIPDHARRLAEAQHILRARIDYQGSRMAFSSEKDDYWWWLMQNADVNAARLMLSVLDDPAWKDDMGRLASGFIGRQQSGAWHTTTANVWGTLALEKFSARFEATPVTGTSRATLGAQQATVDWGQVAPMTAADMAGAVQQTRGLGAPPALGMLRNNGMFLPWAANGQAQTLQLAHQGSGKPWLSLQALAAVPRTRPMDAGYRIRRSVVVVQQADPALPAGHYSRGDILRITLEVDASADMAWAVVTDPIPAGATILGGGLGRDSVIATQGEQNAGRGAWPAFEERDFAVFRSYYEYLPKGVVKMQYTIRLNNAGSFALPPSRVEAMYAPEMFGESPNAPVTVEVVK